MLGQLKGLFTLDIHDQIGPGVYCLFGGLFTLHCGHNTQVSSLKNPWYLLKFILPMKLKLDSSYNVLFNIKKNGLYVDFNVSYMNVEIIFFNPFYISLSFFCSLICLFLDSH